MPNQSSIALEQVMADPNFEKWEEWIAENIKGTGLEDIYHFKQIRNK